MKRSGLRRGNWSTQELERLRHLLPGSGVAATARVLRRSVESVERKAFELLRTPLRHGAWTESDDAQLRRSWGAVEPRLLGAMLGRQPAAVLARVAELRQQLRRGPWTCAEEQMLKEFHGSRRDTDLEIVLLRQQGDIAQTAQRLCLAKDKRLRRALRDGVAALAAPVRMPRWTAAEVVRLREVYADLDNLAVARLLGRSVTSVANKANQIGLTKSPALLASIGRRNVAVRYSMAQREAATRQPGLGNDRSPSRPGGRGGDAAQLADGASH